jgi:antitoxin VapB
MALNIKDKETCRIVRELARLTGETMTAAVASAVREKLTRARRRPKHERLLAIARDCAARIKEPLRSIDHGELLYDERGLPRND